MKLVILGMPGAGKGTVAAYLERKFGWRHISTGDVLRTEVANESSLGKRVKNILESGKLVDDSLMTEIVKKAIEPLTSGFVLDGYPRTLRQCELLTSVTDLSKVIYLYVEQEVAIERLLNRSHSASVRRSDDTKQVIIERLALFQANNQAILDYYGRLNLLVKINGTASIETVHATVSRLLS
ncbi:adenylate kinase [Spirochaetota bacterium]|nr:adenylate kinase [Spirochaetota bacterium]